MKFSDVVKNILPTTSGPMTPQEIRDQVKMKYPDFYGTPSHCKNVEKGHYKDIDHALLAQIYSLTGTSDTFQCDKSTKPMRISLVAFDKPLHRHSLFSESVFINGVPEGRKAKYEDKVREIITNADKYHDDYYKAETFRGPSLYFHQRALATRHAPVSFTHCNYSGSPLCYEPGVLTSPPFPAFARTRYTP